MRLANGQLRRSTSFCLIWATVLIPGGFFLGGFATFGGDPGLGVWLVPIGATPAPLCRRPFRARSVPEMKKSLLLLSFFCLTTLHAELPPLIPREILFGNPERSHPEISPDGKQIAWLAGDKSGVLNVWVSGLDGKNAQTVTSESHRPILWYKWNGDGKHILYLQDNDGNEIDHLFSADLETKKVRDLTPFPGVRAQNVLTDPQHPKFVLVALNKRDPHAFDMYRVDIEAGAITLEAENPGDVLTWKTDKEFVIRAATAFDGKTGNTIIRVRDAIDKPWRDLVTMPFERALFGGQVVEGSLIAGFDPDGKSLIIHSALHSDKGRLVRVNLSDGKETDVLAQDEQCDVADENEDKPKVIRQPKTHKIQAVAFDYATPHWVFLDPELKANFEQIGKGVSGFLDLVSRDFADQKWIIAASTERCARFLLLVRSRKENNNAAFFRTIQAGTLCPVTEETCRHQSARWIATR